jgi:adenylylsulfate kinase-like enzyme
MIYYNIKLTYYINMKNWTIWFTGLSSTGKSTLAKNLYDKLKTSYDIVNIDGDIYRADFKYPQGFSDKERYTNINSIAILAKYINGCGQNVIISSISPYWPMRLHCRELIEYNGKYFQIYCKCDFENRLSRDIKNKKFVVSQTDLYEEGNDSEIIVDTGLHDVYNCITNIKLSLVNNKILTYDDLYL